MNEKVVGFLIFLVFTIPISIGVLGAAMDKAAANAESGKTYIATCVSESGGVFLKNEEVSEPNQIGAGGPIVVFWKKNGKRVYVLRASCIFEEK